MSLCCLVAQVPSWQRRRVLQNCGRYLKTSLNAKNFVNFKKITNFADAFYVMSALQLPQGGRRGDAFTLAMPL